MPSVLQDWVQDLTFMQQSVLITCCRGPDTLHKKHISKMLCRWLRRCFLLSAFDRRVLKTPYDPAGGSFTGPCTTAGEHNLGEHGGITHALKEYMQAADEVPHHFQMHLVHAAEILGYKHPDRTIREWWHRAYMRMVRGLHLYPETEANMDHRLGDGEGAWQADMKRGAGFA